MAVAGSLFNRFLTAKSNGGGDKVKEDEVKKVSREARALLQAGRGKGRHHEYEVELITDASQSSPEQFTCCASTRVQILTLKALQVERIADARGEQATYADGSCACAGGAQHRRERRAGDCVAARAPDGEHAPRAGDVDGAQVHLALRRRQVQQVGLGKQLSCGLQVAPVFVLFVY